MKLISAVELRALRDVPGKSGSSLRSQELCSSLRTREKEREREEERADAKNGIDARSPSVPIFAAGTSPHFRFRFLMSEANSRHSFSALTNNLQRTTNNGS